MADLLAKFVRENYMEVFNSTRKITRSFVCGCLFGVMIMYGSLFLVQHGWFTSLIHELYAATGIIEPDGDSAINGVQGAQNGSCGGTNAGCLADATSASTTPNTSNFVLFDDGETDYYTLGNNLTDVATATAVRLYAYHQEDSTQAMYLTLFNAAEDTPYGVGEIQLPNRGSAQWDANANYTGLTLSQSEVTGLRVRADCRRPGGGKKNDCWLYALYAEITYDQQINLTVSTTSSQRAELAVGTTSAHVGGAFVITENSASRDITSITIEENGSVDAQNDLDNIELWYETSGDCSTESFNGTNVEKQFGSTDTNGFSAANGTSQFTDSGITIDSASSTASELCIYPVLDVLDSAGAADTLAISINNPSTDVGGSGSPSIEPNTQLNLSGTTTLTKVEIDQTRFHWRQDNGGEGDNTIVPPIGADSATGGSENATINNATKDTHYRLRLQLSNGGNATSTNAQYRLEYGVKTGECNGISESNWIDVDTTADAWDMVNSADSNFNDGNTTNITNSSKGAITDPGGGTFVGSTNTARETTSVTGNVTLDPSDFTELEFSLNASSTITDGTTYCFRATSSQHVLSYTLYPEMTFNADVVVATEEAQPTSASIPTTGLYVGGFLITDNTGSHDIDEITIKASSTVSDITTAFADIQLFYENDTSNPYTCDGMTYDGIETQYGGVAGQTNAAFSANGTSTFTGGLVTTPTVTQTSSVCLYVVLDVTSSTTNGDVLDIQIENPSVDVVLDSGTVAPASLIDLSGTTTFTAPYVNQVHYHWRDNASGETNASSTVGDEDTPFTELPKNIVQRLRFGVANTGGEASGNYQYQLEWAQKVTTCDAVSSWTDIDTSNDDWEVTASQLVDNADTTDISTTTGGVTNVGSFLTTNGGQQEVDGITGNINLAAGEFVEIEYSLRASTSVSEGAGYCFRLTNNGTPLNDYNSNYAEATIKLATDFAVYRNSSVITGTSLTLTEGPAGDYDLQFNDPSRAFIRITNAHHTGGGPAAGSTGNHTANNVTAYISNPENIATSVNLTRPAASNDTRVSWEIVEYLGDPGGENEFIVREAASIVYDTAETSTTTGTIASIADDNDVVPFITGQGNPDGGRQDYESGLSTSAWNSGTDSVTFTRGHNGSDAGIISYAVVEFTGSNWEVERAEHTYSAAGVAQTETLTGAVNMNRTFTHAQHRAGSGEDKHSDFGHLVWLSGMTQVSFQLNTNASTPSAHASVVWVIENLQSTGDVMEVQRPLSATTIPAGGGGLTTSNHTFATEVGDFSVTSLFITSNNDESARTFPEPMISAELISTTQFQLQVSDDGAANNYRYEVVEWPTAARKLVQNYYKLYVDNDAEPPTDAWPVGATNLGENQPMTATSGPIASGENLRIRMSLNVTAASMPAGVDSFKLEYGEQITTCAAVADWHLIGEIGSTTALWRAHDGTPADGTTLSSTTLSVSDVFGTYEEENPTALNPNVAVVGEDVEYDWNVENNGAADKTNYCFRMVEGDGTPLFDYNSNGYPIVRTVGYQPEVDVWKWFDDETNLTPTSELAGTNTAPSSIALDNLLKLRIKVREQSGAEGTDTKFKVQYSEQANFSSGVYDLTSTGSCNASSTWCYADGVGVDNNQVVDNTLGGVTCNGGGENGCGTHNEGTSTLNATFDHQPLTAAEFEFTLQPRAARANAVYYFRLYDVVNDEVVGASSSYPSLQMEGATLSFTMDGISSGTTIDSETMDFTTSTTSVPFSSIQPGIEYTAGYRINVNTNATEGYKVLMVFDQPLTNSYGAIIEPVAASNASPVDWNTGCDAAANSCFGYHVEDDILDGGSMRFSLDDTFAAISTTSAKEVMYSSVPADDQHDIVFKLLVRGLQQAGDYTANLTLISVPIF